MANLSIGIVGLPNVGKSTLFNALVQNAQAEASNYPFCTIEPNVGSVPVPDNRLAAIAQLVQPQRTLPTTVEFWDIAGIIKGASQGEGLGNQFLAHIRQTGAIALVLRCFENPDIIHVNGTVNPAHDLEVIQLELILADLATAEKALDRYRRGARLGGEAAETAAYAEKIFALLSDGKPASLVPATTPAEHIVLRELCLLSAKPQLIVLNVSESEAGLASSDLITKHGLPCNPDQTVVLCAQLEAELALLEPAERREYLESYSLTEAGLTRFIQSAYRLLSLITFFTAGPQEVRAWTVRKDAPAPEAAGVIHTDFIKHFIRAEAIAYADFVADGGESGAQAAGHLRVEGKDYIVKDGDILHFRVSC